MTTFLETYIIELNTWKKQSLPLGIAALTEEQICGIWRFVSQDLRPSALSCNGKLTGAALRMKHRKLLNVRVDLKQLAELRRIALPV